MSEPGTCPECGAEDLDYNELLFDINQEMTISHSFTCKNCGVEGTDHYSIEFQETTIKEEPDVTQS